MGKISKVHKKARETETQKDHVKKNAQSTKLYLPRHKHIQTKMTHCESERGVLFTPQNLEVTLPLILFCSAMVDISTRLLTLLYESKF